MSLPSPRKREFVRVVSEMDLEVCVVYVFRIKSCILLSLYY
jgi:hypothetical protein